MTLAPLRIEGSGFLPPARRRLLGFPWKSTSYQRRLAIVAAFAVTVFLVSFFSYHEDTIPSPATVTGTWEGPAEQLTISGRGFAFTYPGRGNPVDSTYAVFEFLPSLGSSPIRLVYPHTVGPTANGTYRVLDPATLEVLANGSFRNFALGAPYYFNSTRLAVFGSYIRTVQDLGDSRELNLAFTDASDRDLEMKVNPIPTPHVTFDTSFTAGDSSNFVSIDLDFANVTVDGQSSQFDRSVRLLITDFGEFALSLDAFEGPIIRFPIGLSLGCRSCDATFEGPGNATYQDNTSPFKEGLDIDNAEFLDFDLAAPFTPFRFGAVRVMFIAASALVIADGVSIAANTRISYSPIPWRELRETLLVVSGIVLTVPMERVVEWWLRRNEEDKNKSV